MYRDAVKYNGIYLAPGSEAMALYQSKKPEDRKKLDLHLKKLDQDYRKLSGLDQPTAKAKTHDKNSD